MPTVAAVTMVYNEHTFLPAWLRHYGAQVGIKHCFVVDHGSTDGSTADLGGAGYLPLPRGPLNEKVRSDFISNLCNALLGYYDWVLYADADEFLVADPARHGTLVDLCGATSAKTIRAIGLDVVHLQAESPLDFARPIVPQRHYARFAFAMCKPSITSVPIHWDPGFHNCAEPSAFDGLFLFHISNIDRDTNLARLARSRALTWTQGENSHQQVSDEARMAMFDLMDTLPMADDTTFDSQDPHVAAVAAAIDGYIHEHPTQASRFYVDLHQRLTPTTLWRIPYRFAGKV